MKKAFTLVELLVVVVVIVTLMTITFKLAGAGGDSTARNVTINRMQRLENCLSGYYAAYGSYPPVKLHGSRDYTYQVNANNLLQYIDSDRRWSGNLSANWQSVEAACRSQPLDFAFPYSDNMTGYMDAYCQAKRTSDPSSPQFFALVNNSTVNSYRDYADWNDVQLYKYGVMSYLLPRLVVIMHGEKSSPIDNQLFSQQRSWYDNNQMPCRFEDGAPYSSWNDVNNDANQEPWKIAALPSQAATARWLPNLEGICSWLTSRPLYGINIRDGDDIEIPHQTYFVGGAESTSQGYKLNTITVKDGFHTDGRNGNPFYYYSPPPHQTYTLWSAGANGRTFPPWVTDEEINQLTATDRQTVQTWVSDDIVHMSN